MDTRGLEHEVSDLKHRVDVLEEDVRHTVKLPGFNLRFSREDVFHTGGWFVMTVFGLALLRDWQDGSGFNLIFGLATALGAWVGIQGSGFVGISDSTRILLQEARAQKEVHSTRVHTAHPSRAHHPLTLVSAALFGIGALLVTIIYAGLVLVYLQGPNQALALLLLPSAAVTYSLASGKKGLLYLCVAALYAFIWMGDRPIMDLAYLAVVSLALLAWSVRNRNWSFLTANAFASFAVLGSWAVREQEEPRTYLMVLVVSLFLTLFYNLPFVYVRRSAEDRVRVRSVIFLTAAYFVALPLLLTNFLSALSWELTIAICIFLYAGLAAISWLQYGRFSYAKYYGLAIFALLIVMVGALASPGIICLFWFMLSIALLAIGFAASSYTLRMSGLGLYGLTLAYYVTGVFPKSELLAAPIVLQERVWIGALLAIFALVIAFWYDEDTNLIVTEKTHRVFLLNTLYLASFSIVAALDIVITSAPLQTMILILAGAIVGLWGLRKQLHLLQALGIATVGTALLKLVLTDSLLLDVPSRLVLVGLVGVVALGAGLVTYKQQ